jgi:hypothetical protein
MTNQFKKNLEKATDILADGYVFLCTMVVTLILMLFAFFGGEITIDIHWESWSALLKTLS